MDVTRGVGAGRGIVAVWLAWHAQSVVRYPYARADRPIRKPLCCKLRENVRGDATSHGQGTHSPILTPSHSLATV